MRILLDFDDVMAELTVGMVAAINDRFGTDYQPRDKSVWNWYDSLPIEQRDFVWGPECYGSRAWILRLNQVPDSSAGVKAIAGLGHRFVVVTDRKPFMAEWVHARLAYMGLHLPIVTANKTDCTKLDVAEALGLDVVIEDAPHHARTMSAAGRRVFLLNKPSNQDVDDHPLIRRVDSWREIVDEFAYGGGLLAQGVARG